VRSEAADATKQAILDASKALFSRHGIDQVTITQIAERAGVAGSTIYALYKSKEGIIRALMTAALFGDGFQAAQAELEGVTDPVKLMSITAKIARTTYEGESSDLGLLRGASAFSPALRALEEELEGMRYEMQEARLQLLRKSGRLRPGLTFEEARRLMWMYTSRDIYRMLVQVSGWSPARYQEWLAATLVETIVAAKR
jgi:AcrR family transcriptional regulator